MSGSRLRDLIEAHVKTLTATADSRHTRLLAGALRECLRRAVEREQVAEELAAKTAEVQRLRAKARHLEARVRELEAGPAADVSVPGSAPPGWSMVYHRKYRTVTVRRPDGVQLTVQVYPDFWPEESLG